MKLVIIIALLFNTGIALSAQFDAISFKKNVENLRSQHDHQKFWKEIRNSDQQFRGEQANDSIDFVNLLKCCLYVNQFGYPKEEFAGKASRIISYVWIHNKFPEVDALSFPIILQGYRMGKINEKSLRTYYLRSVYKRKFANEGCKDLYLGELFSLLELEVRLPINIDNLIRSYRNEVAFLRQAHIELGVWEAPTELDTLYYDNKQLISNKTLAPIRLFKSVEGDYYFQRMNLDGSHYPQKIIYLGDNFKIFKNSVAYFMILDNGNLKVCDEKDTCKFYTRRH